MSMGAVWFTVGMIFGMIAMVVISCAMAGSNTGVARDLHDGEMDSEEDGEG